MKRVPRLVETVRLPDFRDAASKQEFWRKHDAHMYQLRLVFLTFSFVIFTSFALLDAQATNDTAEMMLFTRGLTGLFLFAGLIGFALPGRTPDQRETAIRICALSTCGGEIILIVLAPAEIAAHYQFGLGLIISAGALLLVPRFSTTVQVLAITLCAYAITLPWHSGGITASVVNTFYIIVIAVAVLIGSYERERLARLQAITGDALERSNMQLQASRQAALDARDKEIAANRAKNQFLASVSHELRTPMNAILGFSGIIRSEMFGPVQNAKYAEYIEHIHSSGLLLQTNIDDLLDLARLEAGKIGWVDELFTIETALENIQATCRLAAEEAGVALDISNNAPGLEINADPTRIVQAVVNLTTNAVKFSSAGQTVRIRVEPDLAGNCAIQVIDAGCGMSPDHLEMVRMPFAQAHEDSYSKGKGGLGLGLAIVSGITEMLEGRLDLDSKEDAGTTATLVIPAHRIVSTLRKAA